VARRQRGEGSVFYIPSVGRWAAQFARGRRLTAPTEEAARALLPQLRAERDAAARMCEVCGERPVPVGHSVTCGSPECKRGRKRQRAGATEAMEANRWADYAISNLAAKVGKAGDIDGLPYLWDLMTATELAVAKAIDGLREHGYSWADIGDRLGMTKQNAHKWRSRHGPPPGMASGLPGDSASPSG
jgi:hypothetical protein